jgi:hypothetical protein
VDPYAVAVVVTSSSTIEKRNLEFYCQLTAPSVNMVRGRGMVQEPFTKKKPRIEVHS